MAQNIYDNPAFFEGYAQLPRSVQGLDGAPEWPALKSMLPDLNGKRVIDLGCGYGWFCRVARDLGASAVTGDSPGYCCWLSSSRTELRSTAT
jgi:2-polyprenyl-3-methyl-5-hydroxy-6-metoxy-1,4-benzoquinol methylase